MTGTKPVGAEPGQEARWVRQMFARVAPRYDLLNHLLSFQIDRYWRRFTVEKVRDILERPGTRVLDLCCGTGDLVAALERVHRRPVFGVDFCRPMLNEAHHKLGSRARLIEADALVLPLPSECFDVLTIAFGLRNLADYRKGLDEMHRLLRAGGSLAVLEFSWPRGRLVGPLYGFYFRHLLPCLGGVISGAGKAYRYLQQSVERFPSSDELSGAIRAAGFREVRDWPLTGGIAVLHVAVK
ncbi:MAG: bifunctional demethylmenaquinone methyltransferase/2-methoxy-6-polyprenyl-1,4-benzoquinol methylase UbiE [Acidobacteria bacterium]|nr:bifunctional demethylmenaquinone methyltransferase/2-methoxy-6-polyprenyl-1,4-benzoquinol methylase UbiE [Acidobacteriota bacterium]